MIKPRGTLIALVTTVAAVGACQANNEENSALGGAGGSSGSSDVRAGAPGAGASGHSPAGEAGSAGEAGEAGAGSSGRAGAGPKGGSGGAKGGAAGAPDAAGNGGDAGEGDGTGNEAGSGGSAGSPDSASSEHAYLTTFLGGIFAFSIDSVNGKTDLQPGSPVDVGAQIYSVSVDPSQRHLYVLDLRHKLDVFAINADGTLPAAPASSTPLPGSPVTLALDPEGRFAYVGTQTDEAKALIESFELDSNTGALSSAGAALELGGAPSYVAVDPTGHFAYVTQSTGFGIWGYSISQTTGLLAAVGPQPFGGNAVFGGAIAFRPDRKFLYTTGNGLNAFAIDSASGKLERVEGSPFNPSVSSDATATNIALTPNGKYLYATQFVAGSHVFGFSVDDTSGKLTALPGATLSLSVPYSISIEPFGRFVYVGRDDGKLSVLAVKPSDGSLHEVDGSPIEHGGLQPELAFAHAP